jgi:hypothetical protein
MATIAMVSSVQAETLVYDNLINPLGNYLGGFAYEEVADDVQLSGGGVFSRATVAYAGFNFDGDETLTLNLYQMDGAPTPGSFGFDTPGTLLYSQTLPIAATDGALIDFIDLSPSVNLPANLGIGLTFGGVDFDPTGAGSDAGPLLYHPPGLGTSLDDYWLKGFPNPGDDWGLFTFGGNPAINIGVQICVVPESSTWTAMLGFAGIAGSVAFRRSRRSR